jgi:proteasome accessory factor B
MKRGKPAKKYSQAARVHDIIRLIEARHGMTIDELAEETCVTRRTVHRDLVALHDAGYPLVSVWEGQRKVYRFISRFKDIPPVSFTLQEIATLYLLRGQGGVLHGTPFESELEAVFMKIRSALPPRFAAHLERIAGVPLPLLQGRHDYSAHSEILMQLRESLVHQNRLTFRYRAHGRKNPSTYLVDPYSLAFYKGGIYLIGYAHNRNGLRTFAVERIINVVIEKERFEMPDDYQPEARLRDAFGIVAEEAMDVRIRFSPVVAATIRGRVWHPSQRFEDNDDGGVELNFTAGGKMEIVSWVLSYGEHAEVIAPVELREMVASTVSGVKDIYSR